MFALKHFKKSDVKIYHRNYKQHSYTVSPMFMKYQHKHLFGNSIYIHLQNQYIIHLLIDKNPILIQVHLDLHLDVITASYSLIA